MRKVLTEIEKLEARFPGFLVTVKAHFEAGRTAAEIPALLHSQFGVSVTETMVAHFRCKRWSPEKDRIQAKRETATAAIEAFGGDTGFDALVLAKLWELMDEMTIPQLFAARTLFVKIRAQNLKEQEFLFKTGQLKPQVEELDRETQSRNALRRIKEIFGLAGDEPPKPPVRQPPIVIGAVKA